MKLPDEMVERAAKAAFTAYFGDPDTQGNEAYNILDEKEWEAVARAVLEVVLSEGGTTQRFCLYHGATAVSDPETTWCRIADRSNPKSSAWCKVIKVAVIPLESKE